MKVEQQNNLDNSKLLSLIDIWRDSDQSKETYDNVIHELYNGLSFFILQTYTKPEGNKTSYNATEDLSLSMPYYTVGQQRYFAAFTDQGLMEKFFDGKPNTCIVLPSRTFLEVVEKSSMGGVIIDTNVENPFVVYRKTDT